MFKKIKIGLLPRIILAISLGVVCSLFFPNWMVRIFSTINGIFGNFLSFSIPLIILGLVAPGIADLGSSAGRLLGITAALAYLSTLFAGFMSFFVADTLFPYMLNVGEHMNDALIGGDAPQFTPYFTMDMPPLMSVVGSLLIAFILGLGLAHVKNDSFRNVLNDFSKVVSGLISSIIIPLLPLFIFGIFLKMGAEGAVAGIMTVFVKVLALVIVMQIALLIIQYTVAGAISGKNPFKALKTMLTAYVTALGTQSSAATIPVTLEQTKKNGVKPELAGFVIPLCATIHLGGSTMMITTCSMAVMVMSGMPYTFAMYVGFIMMLGVTMVAAPGVPGGAIMAAIGILQSMLGFDETMQALMIALYITMDSFGTACNVTGDGAIALIVNKFTK
ncbi:MAG: dicarboxylate/amino acid:cation symporter [Rikenellaceae bacterium]